MFRCSFLIILCVFLCAGAPAQTQQVTSAQLDVKLREELTRGVGAHLKGGRIESLEDARKAAGEFANYIQERTGHRLPKDFVLSLASAEWRARSAGNGTLPVALFAERATSLFLEMLGGAGAKAPTTGSSSPYYVVTPEKLNGARLFYRRHAAGVVASDLPAQVENLDPSRSQVRSVQTTYPIEGFLALYTCVSEDLGRELLQTQSVTQGRPNDPSATMSRPRRPFGDLGYSVKRPVARLFTERILSELLSLAQ